MWSSSCISVILLLLCLESTETNLNPQCIPPHGSNKESVVKFLFFIDHTLGKDAVDRIKYLFKAISCEIPISRQYQLAVVDMAAKSSFLTTFESSKTFPDALQYEVASEKANEDACHRLRFTFDTIKNHLSVMDEWSKGIPFHFVIPFQKTYTGCGISDEFRKFFQENKNRFNASLDIIAIGSGLTIKDADVRVVVGSWDDIKTDVSTLTKHKHSKPSDEMDELVKQYSEWVHKVLSGESNNDVLSWDTASVQRVKRTKRLISEGHHQKTHIRRKRAAAGSGAAHAFKPFFIPLLIVIILLALLIIFGLLCIIYLLKLEEKKSKKTPTLSTSTSKKRTPAAPSLPKEEKEPLIKPVAVDSRSPTDKTQESTNTAKSFKNVMTRSRSNEALLSPNLLEGAGEPKMHTAIAMDKDGEEEKEVATAKLIDDEETKGVATAKLINSEEDKEHTAILYKSGESKTPPTARLASPEDLKVMKTQGSREGSREWDSLPEHMHLLPEQKTQSKEWDLLPEKKTQEGSRERDLLPEKKTQDSREIEPEVRSVPLYDPIVYSHMPRTKKSTSRIIPISRKKRGKKEEKTQDDEAMFAPVVFTQVEQRKKKGTKRDRAQTISLLPPQEIELEQLDVDVSGRRRSRSRQVPDLPERRHAAEQEELPKVNTDHMF
uniref:Uncharacterized protein n=1 Tax=Haemonchus contortus TaxID=6289 RepID=A0A7I5EAF2_HAECO